MSAKKKQRELFACPNCGADVAVGSKVCRECGSDASTGWQDSTEVDYQSLDLPDGYRDDVQGDELPPTKLPAWVRWTALLLVVVLLVAFSFFVFWKRSR